MSCATIAPFTEACASSRREKYERTRSRMPSDASTDAMPMSPDRMSITIPGPSTPR